MLNRILEISNKTISI